MSDFRPLSETELAALSPERLIVYHHEARRLGRNDEARTALAILVWGFRDRVKYWVSRKVPAADVEDVANEVIESAIRSSFDRATPGQFGAWLRRIAQRRVADYHAAGARRPDQVPLPEEHEGEEEIWGVGGAIPDPTQEVVERSVVVQRSRSSIPSTDASSSSPAPRTSGSSNEPARRRRRRSTISFRTRSTTQ
jgi:DNA-directed RNA polymerase specialized sigma24 family protein